MIEVTISEDLDHKTPEEVGNLIATMAQMFNSLFPNLIHH